MFKIPLGLQEIIQESQDIEDDELKEIFLGDDFGLKEKAVIVFNKKNIKEYLEKEYLDDGIINFTRFNDT